MVLLVTLVVIVMMVVVAIGDGDNTDGDGSDDDNVSYLFRLLMPMMINSEHLWQEEQNRPLGNLIHQLGTFWLKK